MELLEQAKKDIQELIEKEGGFLEERSGSISKFLVSCNHKLQKLRNIMNFKTDFYKDLLNFLSSRRQSSYLTNGFIKAALGYLFKFYDFQ